MKINTIKRIGNCYGVLEKYLGAVTFSSSRTQDSRSNGSVTVCDIVTPTYKKMYKGYYTVEQR